MSVNQQLKKFMEVNQLGSTEIGALIGASKQQVNGWIKDGKAIPNLMLENILNSFKDINARWLITGEGSMLDEQKPDILEEPRADYGKDLLDRLEKVREENGGLKERVRQCEKIIADLTSGESRREQGGSGARAG